MRNLFEHTSASWVHYSDYEWKETKDHQLYLIPAEGSTPKPYDPMKDAENLVLSAMDIGLMCFKKEPEAAVREAMREFACKYGLLGIMTALPTTAKFIDYEKVYFPYNEIVKTESMETLDYLKLFFPFQIPEFSKDGVQSLWNTSDRMMIALAMTYHTEPQAMVMSFMRDYGERYDWLVSVFRDWAFTFMTTFLYYTDKDTLDEETLDLYRKGMAALRLLFRPFGLSGFGSGIPKASNAFSCCGHSSPYLFSQSKTWRSWIWGVPSSRWSAQSKMWTWEPKRFSNSS